MESIGRLLLLAACLGGAQACASPAVSVAPLQLIIGFTEPVDGAAPATLARLAAASGAEFAYVSSVSPRSHAYRLRCPASDPGCACALAALKAQPSIEYLSPDPLKDSR